MPTVTDHSDPEMDKLVRDKAKAYQEYQIAAIQSFRDSVLKEKIEKKRQESTGPTTEQENAK